MLCVLQNDIVYLIYKLPTVVISRRTDQYSKAHEILTGVAASAAKRPRTASMLPTTAASVPPLGMLPQTSSMIMEGPKLAHASTAPEGEQPDLSVCTCFCNGSHCVVQLQNSSRSAQASALAGDQGTLPGLVTRNSTESIVCG